MVNVVDDGVNVAGMRRLMLSLAVLVSCPALASSSRSPRSLRHGLHHYHHHIGHQHHKHHAAASSPFDDLADGVKDAAEKAGRTLEKVDNAVQPITDSPNRPLMNSINRMRIELCWKRGDLWKHEECMKFLGLKCRSQRTGDGICRDFKRKIAQKCMETKNKKMRKKYCKNAKRAGMKITKPTKAPTVTSEDADTGDLHDDEIDVSDDGSEMDNVDFEDEDDDDEYDEDGDSVSVHDDDEHVSVEVEDGDGGSGGSSGSSRSGGSSRSSGSSRSGGSSHSSGSSSGGSSRSGGSSSSSSSEIIDENKDTDGDGTPDHLDDDIDGDGVPNDKDAFPYDPNEHSDLDGDGIGDNSDDDVDGDGFPNDEDEWPRDARRPGGEGNGQDTDGDFWDDDKDAFPNDPDEWKDSDGDGYGDNSDAYPHDPNCYKDPCHTSKQPNPGDLDKDEERPGGLPEQGYDEHSPTWVEHNDMDTWSADWRKEWPQMSESEKESIVRICFKHRHNKWCKRYQKHFRFAR